MKLVSYNILNAGLGRLDPIYETLEYLNGDVVGLCEADDPAAVRYMGEKLGMEHITAQGAQGRAVALLSKQPIERMVNLSASEPLLDRGALEAVIGRGDSAIRVVVTHLHAGQMREDEDKRLDQTQALLSAIGGQSMPTALMGDLNAAAPYHPFEYASASAKVRARLDERGVRELDHDVVRFIEGRGWIDAYRRARPEGRKQTYTTGFPAARFDYIWVSAALADRVADADVEQGGFAPYCSDHYPIWAELRDGR